MAELADSLSRSVLSELADTWDAQSAAEGTHPSKAETLRECADTIRALLSLHRLGGPLNPDCPHAPEPFRFCPICPVSPCPIGLGHHAPRNTP